MCYFLLSYDGQRKRIVMKLSSTCNKYFCCVTSWSRQVKKASTSCLRNDGEIKEKLHFHDRSKKKMFPIILSQCWSETWNGFIQYLRFASQKLSEPCVTHGTVFFFNPAVKNLPFESAENAWIPCRNTMGFSNLWGLHVELLLMASTLKHIVRETPTQVAWQCCYVLIEWRRFEVLRTAG